MPIMNRIAANVVSFALALAVGFGGLFLANALFPGRSWRWLLHSVLAAITLTIYSVLVSVLTRRAPHETTEEQ